MKAKFREGDFIQNRQGCIFDVKGLVHPPNRIVAFIRYFPSSKGERKSGEVLYEKVYSLFRRYNWIRKNFPECLVYDPVFDEVLCEVPIRDVRRHYRPEDALTKLRKAEGLDDLDVKVLEMASLLKHSAGVPWNAIGVSGSVMVGLHTSESDIDLVVYGFANCVRVYSTIKELFEDSLCPLKPYSLNELKKLFDFRSKDTTMSFEDFVAVESRKVLQGKFNGKNYFIRFVKDWPEITECYGDVRYRNCGYSKIVARVVDDSESIFTPCSYKVEDVRVIEGTQAKPIMEIASFRGRFCEHAKRGETVIAQGKLEQVQDCRSNKEYFRLLLGGKTTDHMILKDRRPSPQL